MVPIYMPLRTGFSSNEPRYHRYPGRNIQTYSHSIYVVMKIRPLKKNDGNGSTEEEKRGLDEKAHDDEDTKERKVREVRNIHCEDRSSSHGITKTVH